MAVTSQTLKLEFELRSAATFGRGDGVAGLIDREVERDRHGLPMMRGRTLRGLLAEEMEAMLHALELEQTAKWKESRDRLLGLEARMSDETGILRVGDACLPPGLRQLLIASVEPDQAKRSNDKFSPVQLLESLTAIRRQTAMSERGAPENSSLRSMRVVLRGTIFQAELGFDRQPEPIDLALLAATVLAWRRAGTGRNRGRGRLRAWIESEDWMLEQFKLFQQEVNKR